MWRLAKICVLLTGGLFVSQVAILSAGRTAYRDPFAPYAAIMPGQPSSNLDQYSCNIIYDNTSIVFCSFSLKEGRFHSATVLYDKVIRKVGFHVRPDDLAMGDLMECWGKPSGVTPDFSAYSMGLLDVHWGNPQYAAIDAAYHGARLSDYFLPISSVSIEEQWRSCRGAFSGNGYRCRRVIQSGCHEDPYRASPLLVERQARGKRNQPESRRVAHATSAACTRQDSVLTIGRGLRCWRPT